VTSTSTVDGRATCDSCGQVHPVMLVGKPSGYWCSRCYSPPEHREPVPEGLDLRVKRALIGAVP
jgi:hypothetical protein